MKHHILAAAALGVLLTAPAFAADQLHANITMQQAKTIALKAAPGTIVASELENEAGGSGLRYSFVIKHGALSREVGVDARTGKVLENAPEGANPD